MWRFASLSLNYLSLTSWFCRVDRRLSQICSSGLHILFLLRGGTAIKTWPDIVEILPGWKSTLIETSVTFYRPVRMTWHFSFFSLSFLFCARCICDRERRFDVLLFCVLVKTVRRKVEELTGTDTRNRKFGENYDTFKLFWTLPEHARTGRQLLKVPTFDRLPWSRSIVKELVQPMLPGQTAVENSILPTGLARNRRHVGTKND